MIIYHDGLGKKFPMVPFLLLGAKKQSNLFLILFTRLFREAEKYYWANNSPLSK